MGLSNVTWHNTGINKTAYTVHVWTELTHTHTHTHTRALHISLINKLNWTLQ